MGKLVIEDLTDCTKPVDSIPLGTLFKFHKPEDVNIALSDVFMRIIIAPERLPEQTVAVVNLTSGTLHKISASIQIKPINGKLILLQSN